MNVAELIRELYKFQPETEVVLLNDEFAEYFSPKEFSIQKLGTYQNTHWHKDSFGGKMSIRDVAYQPKQYKLIKKQEYVLIG